MTIQNKIKSTIKRHGMLSKGETVLVGVSGGADSMSLLHILLELREEHNLKIVVAHLNHGFREESSEEAEFVRQASAGLDITCLVRTVNVPAYIDEQGLSAQEGAREIRYRFFEEAAYEMRASKVALAHNADDQAETVLMRILRGAGLAGLAGIPPVRGMFIRPLIECHRSEIEEYALRSGIRFITDSSNLKTDYMRNRIRLELIPILKTYNPNIMETLIRAGKLAAEDNNALDGEAEKAFLRLESITQTSDGESISIDVRELLSLQHAIFMRVARKGVMMIKGDLRGVSHRHIRDIHDRVISGRGGWEIHLPGVTVSREQSMIVFKKGNGRR